MERIDKKIAENHQRQDFLRKRIQSDKEELAKLESEAKRGSSKVRRTD